MDSAHLDVIRACVVVVILGCLAYFLIPPSDAELIREHDLGEHRARIIGCPSCKRERP